MREQRPSLDDTTTMTGSMAPLRQQVARRAATSPTAVCRSISAQGQRWTVGLQSCSSRVSRYRLQVALATSLAAACIHYSHKPASVESHAHVQVSPTSCRRGGLGARRHATHASQNDQSTSTPSNAGTKPAIDEAKQQRSSTSSQADGGVEAERGTSASSRDAADLTNTDNINELMRHPALMENIKAPRNPIILCHGLYGFDVRGPFLGLEIHYWATVLDILRKKVGAEVIVRGVPGTGAIADRAQALHKYLVSPDAGIVGKQVNFIGHSMGGLDARYLISVIKPAPEQYTPVSLTSISTPHRGSPFMDWCNANVGTGNDRVEKEIREAREKLEQNRSAPKSADAESEEHEGIVKGDFHNDEVKKLPFSLKSPLFVRPTPSSKEAEKAMSKEGEQDSVKDSIKGDLKTAATGVAAGIVQAATSPTSTGDDRQSGKHDSTEATEDKKKKRKSDSLLDFKLFNRALSSLGGSFSSYMLSVLDQPAYAMLSTRYMAQVFNPMVTNAPDVAYFSIAARKRSLPIYHPLWLPKLVLDSAAEGRSDGGERDGSADALGSRLQGNDGLVSVESAKWGKFLGVMEGCDHWDLRGGGAPRWSGKINPQTGKLYPAKEDEKEEKKTKEGGWSDINRLVRRLFSARGSGAKDGAKEDPEANSKAGENKKGKDEKRQDNEQPVKEETGGTSPKEALKDVINVVVPSALESNKNDDGFIDEVATWISDRLPKGDKDRRMQAEQAADEQDKERRQSDDKKDKGSSVKSAENDSKETAAAANPPPSPSSSPDAPTRSSSKAQLDSMETKINKLRREAAWQEELGHDDNARELRRELAWHRTEWNRVMSSGSTSPSVRQDKPIETGDRELDWEATAATEQGAGSSDKQDSTASNESKRKEGKDALMSSADDLERFWVAVCRHLWANGY